MCAIVCSHQCLSRVRIMRRFLFSIFFSAIFGLCALSGLTQYAFADEVVSHGTFSGMNGHSSSGKVTVLKTGSGYQIILENGFLFDGAPDPWVALGHDGVENSGFIAVLQHNSGRQVYSVPSGIDPAYFTNIYIWCKRFTVPLGVAKLVKK